MKNPSFKFIEGGIFHSFYWFQFISIPLIKISHKRVVIF